MTNERSCSASEVSVFVLAAGAPPSATLVFRTLRRGFPTAAVRVLASGIRGTSRAVFDRAAHACGCAVDHRDTAVPLYSLLSEVIMHPEHHGSAVIVDSRVVFWASCEDWRFDGLIAGRMAPACFEQESGYITMARLLPSVWWIPDVAVLRDRIFREYRRSELGALEAFLPYTFRERVSGAWYKFDVGANLYAAIHADVVSFTERELNCFDHLSDADGAARQLASAHIAASTESEGEMDDTDLISLRGLWKAQEETFRLRAAPVSLTLAIGS